MLDINAFGGGYLRQSTPQPPASRSTQTQSAGQTAVSARSDADAYVKGHTPIASGYTRKGGGAIASGTAAAQTEQDTWSLLAQLKAQKTGLNRIIQSVASRTGIAAEDIKKLKIEVDSSGKIVVGGIRDVEATRDLQKRLNKEEGLAETIRSYEANERALRKAFTEKNLGGEKLPPGAKALDYIKDFAKTGQPIECFEKELYLGTRYEGEGVREAFALYAIEGPEISCKAKGVADPSGALNRELDAARKKIEDMFAKANTEAKKEAARKGNADGVPAAEMMSLTNVTISIDIDGSFAIEGRFAESEAANAEAEEMVRSLLEERLEDDSFGGESLLATASRRLVMEHDERYGEAEGKQTVLEIAGGDTRAYIDNPAPLNLGEMAAGLLSEETGAIIAADAIRIDDTGHISLNGAPEGLDADQEGIVADMFNTGKLKNALNTEIDRKIGNVAASFLSAETGAAFSSAMIDVGEDGELSLAGVPDELDPEEAESYLEALNKEIREALKRPAGKSGAAAEIAELLDQKIISSSLGTA